MPIVGALAPYFARRRALPLSAGTCTYSLVGLARFTAPKDLLLGFALALRGILFFD